MSDVTRNVLLALGITVVTVGTIAYSVNYLNRTRIDTLDQMQAQLSVEALSLETQFSLLESAPCDETVDSTNPTITSFTSSMDDLGRKLSYTQDQLGADNPQVQQLERQYSLLEIRDYLLTKKIATACHTKTVTVLYFYSNTGTCAACDQAGNALSYLHNTFPALRVYSFDYHLDLGALQTLISLTKASSTLPSFVINGVPSSGFTTLADLESRFPPGALATTSATSTAK